MSQLIDHRDSLMRILAATENLVALSPVAPYSFSAPSYRLPFDVNGVDLFFSSDADAVSQFAAAMGVPTTARNAQNADGSWYTETTASGDLDGVQFLAWTRTAVAVPRVEHLSVLDTAQAEQVLRDAIVRDPEQQVAYGESILLVTHPEIVVSTDADYGWWSPAMGCAPTPTRNSVQQVA